MKLRHSPSPARQGSRASRRAAAGFTMVEMLSTIFIIGVLTAVAVPSFKFVTNSNRISAEANGLLGDLQFARAEAIKEGQTVTVCVSTNGTSCAAGNINWNDGWIVFEDANGNKIVDANEAVLRYQPQFTSSDTFDANNALAAVTFNREGFALGVTAGTLITLHTAPVNAQYTRCLSVNIVGQLLVERAGGACT
jgi:type IV fimbrial biogenesis protein FimT